MAKTLSKTLKELSPEFSKDNKEIVYLIKEYNLFIKKHSKKDKQGNYIIPKSEIEDFNQSLIKILEKIKKIHSHLIKDSKTDLFNMNFFEEVCNLEFEKSKRDKKDISIIMLDIDFFKKINDIHGHFIGDNILLELSKTLKKSIRKIDLISRFGGDEFILLIQGNKQTTKKIIKRIKENLNKNKLLKEYNLKLSGGIAIKKDSDKDILNLKRRADKALYKAKKNGRDNFIFDE